MNLTARLRRAFDTQARFYEYAELTAPPANDGAQGDWATCYGSGTPTLFGPKTDPTTWPAGAANIGPAGAAGSTVSAWAPGVAVTAGTWKTVGQRVFSATVDHTTGATFRADLLAGRWTEVSPKAGGRIETMDPYLVTGLLAFPVANQLYYARCEGSGIVGHVPIEVGVSSGQIVVGIFANNGLEGDAAAPTGPPLATSGIITCPAVGVASVAMTASTGFYADWIAVAADNTTAKLRCQASVAGAAGVTSGRFGYENVTALNLPANANPTVMAPKFSFYARGVA